MSIKIFEAPYGSDFKVASFFSEDGEGRMFGGDYFFTGEKRGWNDSDWLIVCDSSYSCLQMT